MLFFFPVLLNLGQAVNLAALLLVLSSLSGIREKPFSALSNVSVTYFPAIAGHGFFK